jgi:DNA-binding MarR family transcriptional regulator
MTAASDSVARRLRSGEVADHLDFVLDQWARERPDIDPSPMGVIGRVTRLARLVEPELARTFVRHGLERSSFDVLATLRRSGPPYRLTPAELMRSSMVTSGAVTQRLDRLERRGLIERMPSEIDARSIQVALTADGLELIEQALPDHVANEQRILAALSPTQRGALADLLRRLLESLGDTRD